MKLKVKPEDFIVEEKADLKLHKGGDYKVYLLTKRGFNTVDLLLRLSKKLDMPFSNFSYGGKKDRHALTTQYITIKDKGIFDTEEDSFNLRYVGDMQKPMGPELIKGNGFKIVIRDLDEKEALRVKSEIGLVKEHGFINYFDDQRFGSFDREQGFIGEKIIQNHHNIALKIYLTSIHPEDKKAEKERKRFFANNWGRWDECLKMAKTSFEKRAFRMLLRREKNPFLNSILMIPKEELSLFFSAFQSYLWNKLAERLLKTYHSDGTLLKYKGAYWEYLFYRSLHKNNSGYLTELILPTASQNAKMPDEFTENLYAEILNEHKLQMVCFNLRKIKTAFFKSSPRSLIIIPLIHAGEIEDDELYSGRKKLCLDFELPRGSYGTMLIKRLMVK
ncbi:MAG: tRNA pseudouridine(13) synthase TruD [Deltaproteobacteria bacterium]|nr:tRNA pseudouridine(13) synthase TruD [Deltaproteobacteria bacterium]